MASLPESPPAATAGKAYERNALGLRLWRGGHSFRLEAFQLKAHQTEQRDLSQLELPLPALADVVSALRAGKRIYVTWGRSNATYYMDNGRVRRSAIDDILENGEAYEEDVTEEALRWAIESKPEVFRKAL